MRGAWATAKREAAQAALPKRTPADNLRAEIVSEENRDRGHSFARIAELKAQLSALEGVA